MTFGKQSHEMISYVCFELHTELQVFGFGLQLEHLTLQLSHVNGREIESMYQGRRSAMQVGALLFKKLRKLPAPATNSTPAKIVLV